MSNLLAIDPAITRSGCALFCNDKLYAAHTVKVAKGKMNQLQRAAEMARAIWETVPVAMRMSIDRLVVEWPQIYPRGEGKTKGNPNNLTPLHAVCGAMAILVGPVPIVMVSPAEWKGQLTKTACEDRVMSRLQPAEMGAVVGRELTHDAYDAIAIGMWALGRWERKRVFHGAT